MKQEPLERISSNFYYDPDTDCYSTIDLSVVAAIAKRLELDGEQHLELTASLGNLKPNSIGASTKGLIPSGDQILNHIAQIERLAGGIAKLQLDKELHFHSVSSALDYHEAWLASLPKPRDDGSSSPPQAEDGSSSPPQAEDASSSPLQAEDASLSPLRDDDGSLSPPQADDASLSPLQDDDGSSSPLQAEDASSSPLQAEDASSSPLQAEDVFARYVQAFKTAAIRKHELGQSKEIISPQAEDVWAWLAQAKNIAAICKYARGQSKEIISFQDTLAAPYLGQEQLIGYHLPRLFKEITGKTFGISKSGKWPNATGGVLFVMECVQALMLDAVTPNNVERHWKAANKKLKDVLGTQKDKVV